MIEIKKISVFLAFFFLAIFVFEQISIISENNYKERFSSEKYNNVKIRIIINLVNDLKEEYKNMSRYISKLKKLNKEDINRIFSGYIYKSLERIKKIIASKNTDISPDKFIKIADDLFKNIEEYMMDFITEHENKVYRLYQNIISSFNDIRYDINKIEEIVKKEKRLYLKKIRKYLDKAESKIEHPVDIHYLKLKIREKILDKFKGIKTLSKPKMNEILIESYNLFKHSALTRYNRISKINGELLNYLLDVKQAISVYLMKTHSDNTKIAECLTVYKGEKHPSNSSPYTGLIVFISFSTVSYIILNSLL